ncbi:hypothetical protein MJO28_000867 [Puccinia striiformis f. sp. tritici]|uniref:Uncharacterized protein n=2 Tax=Puccinia striiformis TaxID=27350 RepID=A0A2S4W665_9BASI|nr:hypothetical protein MJO28_000867 [Puccinia striiformis f. sp. tritici]POW17229.1 hypothetical protein PSTT_00565 [Puccinia striiformis]
MTSIEKARLAKAQKRAAQKDLKYIQDNQNYAFTITTALSRLSILDKLDDTNYTTWSEQMIGNLSSLFFNRFIFPIPGAPEGDLDYINKRCVLQFIFGKMDHTNSQRFRSLYNDEVNQEEYQLDQDQNTTVTEHIDNFIKIKTEILNRGGYLEDVTIARKLLNSMHAVHRDEVRHIIRAYSPLTFRGVTLALKQYELENAQLKNKSVIKLSDKISGLNVAGNTNVKKRCTLTHCLGGTHKAAKCFQKPENAAAKKAWFDRVRSRNSANHVEANTKEEEPTKSEVTPNNPQPAASNVEAKKDWAFPTFCAEANTVDSIREAILEPRNTCSFPQFF